MEHGSFSAAHGELLLKLCRELRRQEPDLASPASLIQQHLSQVQKHRACSEFAFFNKAGKRVRQL